MPVVQAIVEDVGDGVLGEGDMEARVRAVTKRELGALILDGLERIESVRGCALVEANYSRRTR
jgi:hypothetical protein